MPKLTHRFKPGAGHDQHLQHSPTQQDNQTENAHLKKMPKSLILPPPQVTLRTRFPLRWYRSAALVQLPLDLKPWLIDRSSLTAKLRQHCQDFQVQRLYEGWQRPLASEAQTLNINPLLPQWTRCVLLLCNDQPFVYARTLIPHLSAQNPWHRIRHLGNQPLGELLFQMPHLTRSPFEFCQTHHHWPAQPHQIWSSKSYARRCQFRTQNAPLLLTEVFATASADKTALPAET